ncbi:techylectin-5B-like [Haliotis asinina]|uniref:techylectin-5B-like n=1 Tax=Haliotis asinina TaxID=109174 RepID=UPI0035323A04
MKTGVSGVHAGVVVLVTVLMLKAHGMAARQQRASTKTPNCEYVFVVNEFDTSKCPALGSQAYQADSYPASHNGQMPRVAHGARGKNIDNLSSKMRDMESRLFDEMVKNRELNSTLSRHEHMLKHAIEMLHAYKSNFSSIFRTMMYMETKLKHQRSMSRSLNHKLSNVILDVVEVNNVLTKKVPTSDRTVQDKAISVESVASVRSCPGITDQSKVYKDCATVYAQGIKKSGVYYIKPTCAACPVPVWCDMDTPPGGWLVIQRRKDGSTSFNRNWQQYKQGFGDVSQEHWMGNDNIFLISNQDHYELRVDLWDFEGNRVYAIYRTFKIDGERDKYRLHIHNHAGSVKDSLYRHNRMMFSTYDQDNDARHEAHCAREWEGGWWYNNCWFALLNGPHHNRSNVPWRGMAWNHWKREQLARSEMKIRPSD